VGGYLAGIDAVDGDSCGVWFVWGVSEVELKITCGEFAEHMRKIGESFFDLFPSGKTFVSLFLMALFLLSTNNVDASVVTVKKNGEVVLNVLAAEDTSGSGNQSESLTVSQSSVAMGDADMPISLFRKDGKYVLNIAGKNGEQDFDISNYKDNILEIEQRPSIRKIDISLSGNQFVIEQSGVKAKTSYQINIEPLKSRITILTPTGYKFLTLLPADAVNVLYRSNVITSLTTDRSVEISEDDKGNLFYLANGTKRVGIKDLYEFDAPVSAKISAVDGSVMEINQPIWLKILSLFTIQT